MHYAPMEVALAIKDLHLIGRTHLLRIRKASLFSGTILRLPVFICTLLMRFSLKLTSFHLRLMTSLMRSPQAWNANMNISCTSA